jgi:hypothetical protein
MKRTLKRESKVLEIAGIEGMSTSLGGVILLRAWACGQVARIAARLPAACRLPTPRVLSPCPRSGWIHGELETPAEGGESGNRFELRDAGRWLPSGSRRESVRPSGRAPGLVASDEAWGAVLRLSRAQSVGPGGASVHSGS